MSTSRPPRRIYEIRERLDAIRDGSEWGPATAWQILADARYLLDLETELLADALVLMDQTASPEVQMEARRRIIERHGVPTIEEPR